MSEDIDINGKSAEELMELYFNTAESTDSEDENDEENGGEDSEKAFAYLKAAADLGSPEAWAELGACYLGGLLGIEQNEIKAHDYLEKAALKNAANAQMNLYVLMRDKAKTEEERKNALYWLNQAVENKVPSALYETGSLYYNGYVYEQDYKKAADYFQRSADAGSSEALATLGVMYQQGQGVEKDMVKAVECFAKAADEESITGLYNLGSAYMGGLGLEQDYEEAMNCFLLLTDLEDPFYETPDINDAKVRSDIAQIYHMTKVYETLYPLAHHNLGIIFQQGLGTEIDAGAALYHFMLAAEGGYAPSCLQAGSMLYTGEGIEADFGKAFEYLSAALNAGVQESKLILGLMYCCGDGVEQDMDKGIGFLDDLIAQGNVTAIKLKNDLLNSGN